jgi:DNA-binding transcriptional ArsR family regulator
MKTEARLFKALADETRLQILWLLMQPKKLCVSDSRHITA